MERNGDDTGQLGSVHMSSTEVLANMPYYSVCFHNNDNYINIHTNRR